MGSRREERGAYYTIFKELAIEDSAGFAEYMRMPHGKFNELSNIIGPSVQKKDTVMRNAIPPGERLALTLRYLATGESFQSLSFQFRIGRTTIGEIVMEVCTVILDKLILHKFQMPQRQYFPSYVPDLAFLLKVFLSWLE